MVDQAASVQDLRRLPGRLSLALPANYTPVIPDAPVTHDVAIAARHSDSSWTVECECGDTLTASTETAAWNAFDANGGGVRP